MKSVLKLSVAMILGLVLILPVTAHAATIDDVRMSINNEYSAGNISDMTVRDNLVVICNNIKVKNQVGDTEGRNALVDTLRLAVDAHDGITMTNGAADRIEAVINALAW